MSKHSTLVGSSSAERVVNCPGSVRLSAGVPKDTSSSYADEGTMLHSIMEKLLNDDVTPEELVGYEELGHEFTDALCVEMIEPAIEYFDDLIKRMGGDLEYVTEHRVGWPDDGLLSAAFGTGDVFGEGAEELLYLDWKFGRGVEVSAENSYQGMFCAAAARRTPGVMDMFNNRKKPIRIVIVQPAFGQPSEWVCTHDELDVFEVMLRNAVRSSMSDDAPLETGKWCRWCPAKPICPLKNELAGYALGQDLETEFTAAELGELVQLAYEVEEWADSVLSMAHKQLELGNDVAGYKLVAKKSSGRVVIDEDLLKAALQRKRIKVDEFMPRSMGGVGVIEKVLKAHGVKGKDKDAFMEEHFKMKPSSGNTMVPSDDKRPAVVIGSSGIEQLGKKLAGLKQE